MISFCRSRVKPKGLHSQKLNQISTLFLRSPASPVRTMMKMWNNRQHDFNTKTFMLMHIQMNSSNWRRLLCTIDTLMCHWMKTMHHTSKLNLQTFPFSQYACCVCGGFWLHQSANWISCLTNDSWNKLLTLFDINIHGIQIRFIYVVFRKSHFHCTFSFSHHCIHRTVIWALNDFTALKTLGLVSGHVINFFSLRSCFDVGYIETAFY